MTSRALTGTAIAALLLIGCSSSNDKGGSSAGCDEANLVSGVCAGVPKTALCDGDNCTDGGACSKIISVASNADLAQIAGASSGECVSLAPGDYGTIDLNAGVSLFGRSAADVRVKGLVIKGGASRVAGITFGASAVTVKAGTASIDSVRVELDPKAKIAGITVEASASATVSRSEIVGAGTYGISAIGATQISLQKSLIRAGAGPALWASCGGTKCACKNPPVQVTIADTKIDKNALVGISLVNAKATLTNVSVTHTKVGPDFKAGGGLSISGCSEVSGTSINIVDSTDFGVLIDDSSAQLNGLLVDTNLRGMWVQNIGKSVATATVTIKAADLRNNSGVGFGLAAGSKGVTMSSVGIDNTKLIQLPVLVNGQAGMNGVGDGVTWSGVSQMNVDGLTISKSARASMLIDGSVFSGSTLSNVTLAQGDDGKGILQQNTKGMAVSPTVQNTPPVSTSTSEKYSVPDVLSPPDI